MSIDDDELANVIDTWRSEGQSGKSSASNRRFERTVVSGQTIRDFVNTQADACISNMNPFALILMPMFRVITLVIASFVTLLALFLLKASITQLLFAFALNFGIYYFTGKCFVMVARRWVEDVANIHTPGAKYDLSDLQEEFLRKCEEEETNSSQESYGNYYRSIAARASSVMTFATCCPVSTYALLMVADDQWKKTGAHR